MQKKQLPTKKQQELLAQAAAEEAVKKIVDKFVEVFSAKIRTMMDEFGEHLDGHMDELADMLTDGFASVHEHMSTWERIQKLEKKVEQIEQAGNGKRFVT